MGRSCAAKLTLVVVVLLAFTCMAAVAGGKDPEPPKDIPGQDDGKEPPKQDDGKIPVPPKQDDGKEPVPPKQDDGKEPVPPVQDQDEGKVPVPPKQDDGKIPPPPEQDGKVPVPPKQDDGKIPVPPDQDQGKVPVPPKQDDGKIPPPPEQDGKVPVPPKQDDGKIPPPPPKDDGKIPPPPPKDDGKIPPPPPIQQVLPKWEQGAQWQVQCQNFQIQAKDEPKWLPPVQWDYKVTGQDQKQGQDCYVVEVTQQGQSKPSMKMYVNTKDLTMVETDTVVVVGGKEQIIQQQYIPGQQQGFYQMGPAPSQIPQIQTQQLPPPAKPGQKAAPQTARIKAVIPAGTGTSFETEIEQTVSSISYADLKAMMPRQAASLKAAPVEQDLYRVENRAPGMKAVFVVGTKSAWPLYTETPTQRSWLVTGPPQ